MSDNACKSCGVSYENHPGLELTCASLQTQKLLNTELRRIDAKGQMLEAMTKLAYEMEMITTSRAAELLGVSVVEVRERGWEQSKIIDLLNECRSRIGEHTRIGERIAAVIAEYTA